MTTTDVWLRRLRIMVPLSGTFLVASVIMLLLGSRNVVAWLNVVTWVCIVASLSLSRRALRLSSRTHVSQNLSAPTEVRQ